MAKKVTGYIKLQIPAGKATPAPPVGPALGQHGVNIVEDVYKRQGYRSAVLQRTYARGARITAMAARRGRKEAEDIGAPCCREYTQRNAAECEDK